MKTQIRKTAPVSHTIQSKAKAANQVDIHSVLQKYAVAQREEIEDEDELLQGKFETAQCEEMEDEDELIQGKFETAQREELEDEDELLQGKFAVAQREEIEDDDELLQGKFAVAQREEMEDEDELIQGKFESMGSNDTENDITRSNNTGLPDNLKSGVEATSGYSMDAVRVHYNSPKPAQLQALAYTQGTNIHVAPGQEKHLPHEAWHVVQQMQGRVQPTMQLQGVNINDNEGLEREADVMGERAIEYPFNVPIQMKVAGSVKAKILRADYPQAIGHIDSVTGSKSTTYHIDRGSSTQHRKESLKGYSTKPGLDRDEFPMAFLLEGGIGASVRYISPSDNRGAGSTIASKLKSYSDGTAVEFDTSDGKTLQL